MINPEDETIIVNNLSCTKDEAVAKMLGWMRSPVRLKYIKVASTGIQPDQLEHLHSIEGSILDFLNEQRQFARDSLQAIADEAAATEDEDRKNSIYELINQHDAAIMTWQALTVKASTYLNAIDTELAKGKLSTLKIDDTAGENDEPLIMLDSLDKWAQANFDIAIREDSNINKLPTAPIWKTPKRTNDLREEIIEILSTMENPRPAKVMAALKARVGGEKITCVVGDIGYGIKWSDGISEHEFDMKALRQRIRNLKKL